MKKIYLAGMAATLMLASCGENNDALDTQLTDSESVEEASKSFGEGGATNGEEYFSGIVAEVVGVDVKFREITELDKMDASAEEITKVLDEGKEKIEAGRKALDIYSDATWPKRKEFHDITLEWFASIEALMDDYLYDLATPMAKPDDEWTEEEVDFYNEYIVALEAYYEVDNRWVEFQYEYASANGFEIGGTIDEDAMVSEELENAGAGE
ncbi:MAG: hypothetical protein ACPG21_02415 [Crocinitomicaceae bacterium]